MAKQQPTRPLTVEQRQRLAEQQRKREADRLVLKRLQPPDPLDTALNSSQHALIAYADLHDRKEVHLDGTPAYRDALLRWLCDEKRDKSALEQCLLELHAMYRHTYQIIMLVGDGHSERVIAEMAQSSRGSVRRAKLKGLAWLETRYREWTT